MEFTQILPSPTSLMALGMKPYDGSAMLELNPSLVFPVLEMLLGGTGQSSVKIDREITEIERSILDGLVRIILNDLRAAWQAVATIESHETEPQLMHILAPNEAVVAIGMEVRIGDTAGIMNLGIPSITVKMLRQKFDQQWTLRKTHATEDDHARILRLIQPARIQLEASLRGPTLPVSELLEMQEGDILAFDYPLDRPLDLLVNGQLKYRGAVIGADNKRAFRAEEVVLEK